MPKDTLPAPEKPEKPEKSGREPVKRASFNLTPAGLPDLERMHADSRAQLAGWFADAGFARTLGVAPPAQSVAEGAAVAQLMVTPLLTALGQLQALILQRITNAPGDLALQVSTYTPQEQAAIGPLVNALIEKHSGGWLSRYGQELALAGILLSLGAQKYAQIQELMSRAASGPRAVPVEVPIEFPLKESVQ